MELNKLTFGSSLAAQSLTKLITKEYEAKIIGRLLSKTTRLFNQTLYIPNPSDRKFILSLIKERQIQTLRSYKLNYNIQSYVINIITARNRNVLNSISHAPRR